MGKQVEFHATKKLLIDTVLAMLETQSPGKMTSEQVLARARVSSGSLYHHFHDFGDLMEQVLSTEYVRFIDRTIDLLNMANEQSETFPEWAEGIQHARRMTHGPAYAHIRELRTWTVAQSFASDRLKALLAEGQDRLNQKFVEFIDIGKSRGWVDPEVDSLPIAVFIQSYQFGSVINDVANTQLDPEVWMSLLDRVIARSFLTPK